MKLADKIRLHGKEKYVMPAFNRKDKQFSIRTGDVVRDINLKSGRVPAVCSALKTHEFLKENGLRLVHRTGPPSGQSTTVTYTYEFIGDEKKRKAMDRQDAWERLRGALKDVFAEYGGGEAYLRAERASFRDADDPE